MKKVRGLLVALLALVLALGLMACGGDDKGGKDGAPDPTKVKGEKVTAEQWAAAFDMSEVTNVTVKAGMKVTQDGNRRGMETVAKFDGDKTQLSITSENNGQTETMNAYVSQEGNVTYGYAFDPQEQVWKRSPIEDNEYTLQAILGEMGDLEEGYTRVTYDEDKKAYVYSETEEGFDENNQPITYTMNTTIKIADGKLAVAEVSESDGKSVWEMYFQMYNYGTTSVTLPQATDVGGEGEGNGEGEGEGEGENEGSTRVTQEQWEYAFSEQALANVTVSADITENGQSSTETMLIALDAGCLQVTNGGQILILAKVGEKYYMIADGVASDIGQTMYEQSVGQVMSGFTDFATHFNEFTYDEAQGAYVCYNTTIKFRNGKVVSIAMENIGTQEGPKTTTVATFSAYGSTFVTLPDIQEPTVPDTGDKEEGDKGEVVPDPEPDLPNVDTEYPEKK